MAVDTNVATKKGSAPISLSNRLRMFERTVDFSDDNLASGAWFEIIQLPANSIVIDGMLHVITEQATLTLALGYGGGHELLGATTVATAKQSTAMEHKAVVWPTTDDDVSIVAGAATASTAVVTVSLLVLVPDDNLVGDNDL
ncbi:MAG TPA: hypothetical protein VMW24_27550 [Sedimentisphaerales bacterium]|nr:hypothetical protein [Sedimentisphaerales bacterium]